MASFVAGGISSPAFLSQATSLHRSLPPPSHPPRALVPLTQFKGWCCWRVKCASSSGPSQNTESEAETTTPTPTPSPSSSSSVFSLSGISTYRWCAALGGIGFLETAYLTYLKLTNSDAFCPVGGGTCGDVLNSEYAVVFGVPLPLIGMVAYGLVASLGLQLSRKNLPSGIDNSNARFVLLGSTTAMAAASGYFLYILNTKLSGASCSYCLLSAFLSFSLFFITLKDFGLQEIQKVLALQLCATSLVVITLSTSYGTSQPVSPSLAEIKLQYFTTEITTPSTSFALSLARHLHSIGAKMYGAFWCSHCLEQKQNPHTSHISAQDVWTLAIDEDGYEIRNSCGFKDPLRMFGKEAAELLDYVECFPDGYKNGTKIAKTCADAKIEGFPTWQINGQVLSGEQELSELAKVSGFESNEFIQPS